MRRLIQRKKLWNIIYHRYRYRYVFGTWKLLALLVLQIAININPLSKRSWLLPRSGYYNIYNIL